MTTDRRVDPHSRNRLAEIALGYEEQNRRTTFYLRLFVVLFGVAAVVFTLQQVKLGDQADTTRKLVDANGRLGHQIQTERARSVRDNCEGQNGRHNGTIKTLDRLLVIAVNQQFAKKVKPAVKTQLRDAAREAGRKRHDGTFALSQAQLSALLQKVRKLVPPALRQQIDQSRSQQVFLIDALAPVRNCDKAVHDAVRRTG